MAGLSSLPRLTTCAIFPCTELHIVAAATGCDVEMVREKDGIFFLRPFRSRPKTDILAQA
jgi:hypothetical protein